MRFNIIIAITVVLLSLPISYPADAFLKEGPNSKEVQKQLFEDHISKLYLNLKTKSRKPDYMLFRRGLIGYLNLKSQHKISSKQLLTIIDFRPSSKEKRFWLIDLKKKEVLVNTYVAHGRNTGYEYARKFSNTYDTYQSSIGFYVTGKTYYGKNGLSLLLDGMERGFNSNARGRVIVFHTAKYVSESYINRYGRLGRSLGCPAIPTQYRETVIPAISNKTCMFIYYPDKDYLKKSKLLNNEEAALDFFLQQESI